MTERGDESPARRSPDDALSPPEQSVPIGAVRDLVRAEVFSYHAGPLPAPETFRAYGDVVPDALDRMLRMVEREQTHRHRLETLGQLVAAFAIVGSLVGGFALVLWGYGFYGPLLTAAGGAPSVYGWWLLRKRAALMQPENLPAQ